MGYKIKIDTNGSFPKRLKSIVQEGLVDYVAVDIKNSPEDYAKTIGIENYDVSPIDETIHYLLENEVDYEFRTTVIKEYHNNMSMKKLAEWIKGAKKYYIQNFRDNENVIMKGLHRIDDETLQCFKNIVSPYVDMCEIRN